MARFIERQKDLKILIFHDSSRSFLVLVSRAHRVPLVVEILLCHMVSV